MEMPSLRAALTQAAATPVRRDAFIHRAGLGRATGSRGDEFRPAVRAPQLGNRFRDLVEHPPLLVAVPGWPPYLGARWLPGGVSDDEPN